jgi:peptidoglycan/LPS O-acetylase OafA/YrhL
MRSTIPSLTGLRFIAAFCVLIAHALPKIVNFQNPPRLISLLSAASAEGMSLFFILSGFVIYYNYSDNIRNRSGLFDFFIARFARLYPLYAVGMTYDLLVQFSYSALPAEKLAALPYYATLTQSWIYKPIGDNALIYQFRIVGQLSWSISTEWFFYLVFPFICLAIALVRTVRGRLIASAITVITALTAVTIIHASRGLLEQFGVAEFGAVASSPQDSFFRWLAYFSPYVRVFEFTLGCLCASIYMKLEASPPSAIEQRCGLWIIAGALTAVAALHLLMFGINSTALWHQVLVTLHMNFGFALFLSILIFCCARYRQTALSRLLSTRWMVLCGEASYSLYLGHLLVINAFRYEAAEITSWQVAIGSFLQLAIVIMAAIGLSLVTWSLIEMPSRKWLRRVLAGKRPVPSPDLSTKAPTLAR